MNTELDRLLEAEKKSFARWMNGDHSYNDLEKRIVSRMRRAYTIGVQDRVQDDAKKCSQCDVLWNKNDSYCWNCSSTQIAPDPTWKKN